jgi:hypothetical protein
MTEAESVREIAQPLTRNATDRRKATRGRVRTPKAVAKHHTPSSWIFARSALECDASSHRFVVQGTGRIAT